MTRQEVSGIAAAVTAAYPRFFDRQNEQDMENMIKIWSFTLSEYTYQEASVGLKIYLTSDTKGFPPSPGQIIDCIHKTRENPNEEMTAGEAWELVWNAITSLDWHCPEKAWSPLPEICKRVYPSPGSLVELASMDSDKVIIGEKARFIRQYDALVVKQKEYIRLPQAIRDRIEAKQTKLIEGAK